MKEVGVMERGTIIVFVPVAGAGVVVAGLGAFLLADVIGVVFGIIFWVCAAATLVYGASLFAERVTGSEQAGAVAGMLEPVAEFFGMIVIGLASVLGAGLAVIGLFMLGLWLLAG